MTDHAQSAAAQEDSPGADPRAGALWGTAYGDATGAHTEFSTHATILAEHGPDGPPGLGDGRITDDTQMTLALDQALRDTQGLPDDELRAAIMAEFLAWEIDPDNNRAPGKTCLGSLARLRASMKTRSQQGISADDTLLGLAHDGGWGDATNVLSKGCGTVMRAAPAAFLPDELVDPVSAFAAAVTHGHPAGVAAAILTAHAVRAAARGADPLAAALELARTRSTPESVQAPWTADDRWLADVPSRAGQDSPSAYLAAGYAECVGPLERADAARAARPGDPAEHTGAGWVADECLAAALLCHAWHADDPVAAIRCAAGSGGDSDSIAAVAGAVAGAAAPDRWPADWPDRVELRYRTWLREAVAGQVA